MVEIALSAHIVSIQTTRWGDAVSSVCRYDDFGVGRDGHCLSPRRAFGCFGSDEARKVARSYDCWVLRDWDFDAQLFLSDAIFLVVWLCMA